MSQRPLIRLGETERQILDYLEIKAQSVSEATRSTSEAYSFARELSQKLGKSERTINNSLARLRSRKMVKTFPCRRKYRLLYGMAWLPDVTWESLKK